jgi:hypothetical protein
VLLNGIDLSTGEGVLWCGWCGAELVASELRGVDDDGGEGEMT